MTHGQVFDAFNSGREAKGHNVRTENIEATALIGDNGLPIAGSWTILYSYATPIAYRRPDGLAVFDARKYSQTTTAQANKAADMFRGEKVQHDHESFRNELREIGVYLGGAR